MSVFFRHITFGAFGASVKTTQHPGVTAKIIPSEHDTAHRRAAEAEHRLLSRLSFFQSELLSSSLTTTTTAKKSKSPDAALSSEDQVPIPENPDAIASQLNASHPELNNASRSHARTQLMDIGDGTYLNTFVMDNDGNSKDLDKKPRQTLVIAHGYGAGIGLWYKNYSAWDKVPGLRVFSIDWLGMGRSSRLALPPKAGALGSDEDVNVVENYFVESLEHWRQQCKIEKMVLMGHSLGGYFSTRYALRYPERVEKLILASPAGVVPKPADAEARLEQLPALQKRVIGLFLNLWETGYTPQSVVRTTGPLGRNLIRQYCSRRFVGMSESDLEDVIAYMHSISVLPGGGEYALHRILAPGAWGRRPLADQLPQLKMPVTFIYGEHDWMDPRIAIQLVKENRLTKGSKVVLIPDAGHQLFLDNSGHFNRVILDELNSTSE